MHGTHTCTSSCRCVYVRMLSREITLLSSLSVSECSSSSRALSKCIFYVQSYHLPKIYVLFRKLDDTRLSVQCACVDISTSSKIDVEKRNERNWHLEPELQHTYAQCTLHTYGCHAIEWARAFCIHIISRCGLFAFLPLFICLLACDSVYMRTHVDAMLYVHSIPWYHTRITRGSQSASGTHT